MLGFLLRLRFILLLFRLLLVPLLAFSLALLVFILIGWSLYLLVVSKTLANIPENPYLYGLLFILEFVLASLILYYSVVYINRIRKKYLDKTGGKE